LAVTASWYGVPLKNLFDGTIAQIDWNTDTIKCSLHTSTYTPDKDTHDFFDDATNELTTTGGYTAGGATLASPTITYDTASDEIRLDAADVAWTSASFTARIATIWKDTAGASSTDPLISYVNFGADETVASGTFTITWASNGVAVIDIT
jgi:hypothetical protein